MKMKRVENKDEEKIKKCISFAFSISSFNLEEGRIDVMRPLRQNVNCAADTAYKKKTWAS